MGKEHTIAFAEGIEAGFSGFGAIETMLGTFTVTCKEPFACHAFFREAVTFAYTETYLLLGPHQRT